MAKERGEVRRLNLDMCVKVGKLTKYCAFHIDACFGFYGNVYISYIYFFIL